MPRTIGSSHRIHTLFALLSDATRFIVLGLRSHAPLRAENLFVRKKLDLYIERQTKPRRADDATRLTLALLSWLFAWRDVLVVIKPQTLIGWHRKGFRLFGRWKSMPRGRPRIPTDLRKLVADIAGRQSFQLRDSQT
jgi:putative transposase